MISLRGGGSPEATKREIWRHYPVAEKVTQGVNGLHFSVGDPRSLANVIRTAVTTPGLWDELREGIPPVYGMEEHVASLSSTYSELLERRRPAIAPVPS